MLQRIAYLALALNIASRAGSTPLDTSFATYANGTADLSQLPGSLAGAASCIVRSIADVARCQASPSILVYGFTVPARQTLNFQLQSGARLTFMGTMTWTAAPWAGPLLSISGTNVFVSGAAGHVFDGQGEKLWDRLGTGGHAKPLFFQAHHITGTIESIFIKNAPLRSISVFSNSLHLNNIRIDNSAAGIGLAANTDGIDIGTSSNIFVKNANINTWDDCIAINSGSEIHISDTNCFNTHGISIGSLGLHDANVVRGVTVQGGSVSNGPYGMRIKILENAPHAVADLITWQGVRFHAITQAAVKVDMSYENRPNAISGVSISRIQLLDLTGDVGPKAVPYDIICKTGCCSQFHLSNFGVTGGRPPVIIGVRWS